MKMVVITGVTRGLGRAMAETFAALGHTVAGCGRSKPEIESLRSLGDQHSFDAIDITSPEQVEAWAIGVIGRHGAPDLVINNAGISADPAPLWEVSAEEFSRVVDVNLKGVDYVIRAFVPEMIEHGSGVIVNMSSGWGRSTDPNVAPYCATKWAIEGLTQAFAQELPNGLAAVALSPGIINTALLQQTFGGNADSYESPASWAKRAVPYMLELGPRDNGKSLSVPGGRHD